MKTEKSDLLNAKQLSIILEISDKTVKKQAKDKELPCEFVNRRPLFKMSAILGLYPSRYTKLSNIL